MEPLRSEPVVMLEKKSCSACDRITSATSLLAAFRCRLRPCWSVSNSREAIPTLTWCAENALLWRGLRALQPPRSSPSRSILIYPRHTFSTPTRGLESPRKGLNPAKSRHKLGDGQEIQPRYFRF